MLGYGERWLRWEMVCDGKARIRCDAAEPRLDMAKTSSEWR